MILELVLVVIIYHKLAVPDFLPSNGFILEHAIQELSPVFTDYINRDFSSYQPINIHSVDVKHI